MFINQVHNTMYEHVMHIRDTHLFLRIAVLWRLNSYPFVCNWLDYQCLHLYA